MADGSAVVRCVGAVATDAQGRLLLVRRANEPGRGLWSLPGGRVEPGESDAEALTREVAEETGLAVRVGGLIGRVRIGTYDVGDYACVVEGGTLAAATDALDAGWLDPRTVPTTPGLVATLTEWGVLPASDAPDVRGP
jgi:ADP-ribose pyrophosphatase YjhB (NUDIX family)